MGGAFRQSLGASGARRPSPLDSTMVNALPRWGKQTWLYPPSHLLRADLAAVLEETVTTQRFQASLDDLEYRVGLVEYLRTTTTQPYPHAGDFIIEERWTSWGLEAEQRFRRDAERASNSWPWWSLFESPQSMEKVLMAYREVLSKVTLG